MKRKMGEINIGVSHHIKKRPISKKSNAELKKKMLVVKKSNLCKIPKKVFSMKSVSGKTYTYSVQWDFGKPLPVNSPSNTHQKGNTLIKALSEIKTISGNNSLSIANKFDASSDLMYPRTVESNTREIYSTGEKKFYPIFYKNSDTPCLGDISLNKKNCYKKYVACEDVTQRILDFGQKDIGAKVCVECGMVFSQDADVDRFEHDMFHQERISRLHFRGWKRKDSYDFEYGSIVIVSPHDSKSYKNKANDVLSVVDKELGFSEVGLIRPESSKVYLYVRENKVIGCVVAEYITQGYPLIYDKNSEVSMCSEFPKKALCGVSRIWTDYEHRRKKIATSILECLRATFIYGTCIPKDHLAFSHPTAEGIQLATSYVGAKSFLVYRL